MEKRLHNDIFLNRHLKILISFFFISGDSGSNVKNSIDMLNRGELSFPHIKIVYPTAPAQPYTPNNEMVILLFC